MAWLTHNGKQWYVAYRQGTSRKIRYVQAGPNKRKAQRLRDEIAHRARLAKAGGSVVPEPLEFAEHLRTWLAARTVRATTARRDGGLARKYLIPEFGDRLIGDLKPSDFAVFAARVTRDVSAYTARRALAVASAALHDAVEDERIPKNPVRLPPIPKKTHEEVSLDAYCAVVAAMTTRWRPFVFAALLTGLRFSELTALTWADIDFEAGKLYVRRQKTSGIFGEEARGVQPLKTEASHRPVDMLPSLRRMLLDIPQHSELGLVFPGERGGYISHSHFMKAWRPKVKRLGLRVRFHDLRHGFGSLLLAFGEPLTYVSSQLGHSSASFTLSTYLHTVREGRRLDKDATLARLEASFRGELAYRGLTLSAEAKTDAVKA